MEKGRQRMKKRAGWMKGLGVLALAAVITTGTAGCEDDDYDHDVPAGQGSIVVDNRTGDRIRVYLDGLQVASVGIGDERYYDLDPGQHRVVLDGDDVDRNWADDVDVLQGRLAILKVTADFGDFDDYDVDLDYD